jgi:serine/threonine protein kinase/tetratricopeptide (TPR) repeat protein
MNGSSRDPLAEPHGRGDSAARELRSCPTCGSKFSATAEQELCPVCLLHRAMAGGLQVPEAPVAGAANPGSMHRLEHYELVMDQDGQPLQLGRGAMGVTYKAFDVDLHCPVTLKVIDEKYLGDEAAQQRFLREARAAASVRHPNVASVFHLGRKGRDYFYAMEFVEGETLDHVIKRSGRLEVKLALEVTRQVASGLAAVHKKSLVHRDIKPSNIMVSFEEEGAVTAKIIDLGLAKVVDESGAQTTISASGAFAGTPEFASPEQIVGAEVDIRSDLYSLGVSLWQMLTAQVPFGGSIAVVMAQHQHAALPLERLQGLPETVVSLIEILLDKDPARRFQTPAELLKTLAPVIGALEEGSTIPYQASDRMGAKDLSSIARNPPSLGPEKISIARLPVTGSDLFGREEDLAFLDAAWANPNVNIVSIVAWGGVGKSALINHWLGAMAAQHYRAAELVFGWSFYRQGTSGSTSSADEFLEAALQWFGDPDPRIGTPWEKGERLARLVAQRRTLLVLDGLEPLQNPPGPHEGRLREPSLQAFLRELAGFNAGLCVISTRLPVADIADHERVSALRLDLEHLSSDAGAKVLRALGVKGPEAELRSASDEFNGHCLALTLLGSYLTDAYKGDIRCRKEVSGHLGDDVRQGAHARRVMESYQTWFGDGPELAVLRMLGLFDRPADEKAFEVLLKPPAIPGLTEKLTVLSAREWQSILARLRRARLLAGEDPHSRGDLDTHPLVREFFGEQLRHERTAAWRECNRRLYDYYRTLAPELPENFREMEPLFLAVICGCHAGLYRESLHAIYIARIQRGDACFAVNVLGAREAVLSALVHFFAGARWEAPVETGVGRHPLSPADQLFILMQAALYLAATRTPHALEVLICNARAESLCRSLNRPLMLYVALIGQWRHYLVSSKLKEAMQIATRMYSLEQEHRNFSLSLKVDMALAVTHYYLGDFTHARQEAASGVRLWRSGVEKSQLEEVDDPIIACLCIKAFCAWHSGQISSARSAMGEAIIVAKRLKNTHGIGVALQHSAILCYMEQNPTEAERLSFELLELSTRQHFPHFRAWGTALLGWTRSVAGLFTQGISWLDDGIEELRTSGALLPVPSLLGAKAEALYLANRTSEALETITEAEALVGRSEVRWWSAEFYRLRAIFLTAMDGDEAEIERAFQEAINTAKQQKSISLRKRAEASYAEYRRQKGSPLSKNGLRLPLS